jgi:hypothetical protein
MLSPSRVLSAGLLQIATAATLFAQSSASPTSSNVGSAPTHLTNVAHSGTIVREEGALSQRLNAAKVTNVTNEANLKQAKSSLLTSGPSSDAARAGISVKSELSTKASLPAVAPAPRMGQSVALMVVGGAALIAGVVVGGDGGTLLAIGGAVVGLVGLYQYIK